MCSLSRRQARAVVDFIVAELRNDPPLARVAT